MILNPELVSDNPASKGFGNPKSPAYLSAINAVAVQSPHLPNDCPSKFGFWVIFTAWVFKKARHSFTPSVGIVYSPCSQKEMRRINAQSVVTSGTVVAHAHSFGHRPYRYYPYRPVGFNGSAIPSALSNASIAMGSGSSPQPATKRTAGFFNLGPEPFWKRAGKTLRREVLWRNNQLLNIIHSNLGHALGCSFTARAFSL